MKMTDEAPFKPPTHIPRRNAIAHIRTALKTAFPDIRFRVQALKAWGADTYVIRWDNGPSWRQVREIADMLEGVANHVYISCEYNDPDPTDD
jgi:Large polyvalent protein associated domain 29